MKNPENLIETVKVVEHEDGSVTYTFEMTQEVADICGEYGLKLLMFCGALGKSPEYAFDLLGEELRKLVAENTEGNTEDGNTP